MLKKLNFDIEKKGLNLKTKIFIGIFIFLSFIYLLDKFFDNYTLVSPIKINIKLQNPIQPREKFYKGKKQASNGVNLKVNNSFNQLNVEKNPRLSGHSTGKFHYIKLYQDDGLDDNYRPELEAIYIFFGKDITAYAIAMAESGLNCESISQTKDYGLFQINEVHLPKFKEDKFNCWENARVAYEIYKRQGWYPWVAYTNGSYKKHLSNAESLVKSYFKNR